MNCYIEYLDTLEYNLKEKIKVINIIIDLENVIIFNNDISIYHFINLLMKILNISIHIHTNFYIYNYFNNITLDFRNCNLKKISIEIPNSYIDDIIIKDIEKKILENIDIRNVRFINIKLYIVYNRQFKLNFRQTKEEYIKILKYFFNIKDLNFKNINYYNFKDFNSQFYYLFDDYVFNLNININLDDDTDLELENNYINGYKDYEEDYDTDLDLKNDNDNEDNKIELENKYNNDYNDNNDEEYNNKYYEFN